jgi:uncharacterized protein (DUF1697 family)
VAAAAAFIRGINVGGKSILPMETLRGLCGAAGLADARTYSQSGNVAFRIGGREMGQAERKEKPAGASGGRFGAGDGPRLSAGRTRAAAR